jgi:Uma2 family endonuclease
MQEAEVELSDYEIERGKPMPSINHSEIQGELVFQLRTKYRSRYSILPELSLNLRERPLTPDICIYERRTIDWLNDETKLTAPPLTTIEILSASQSTQDVVEKILFMLSHGVKSCWFVQPMLQTVTLFLPNEKPKTYTEGLLKDGTTDIEISLESIFNPSL